MLELRVVWRSCCNQAPLSSLSLSLCLSVSLSLSLSLSVSLSLYQVAKDNDPSKFGTAQWWAGDDLYPHHMLEADVQRRDSALLKMVGGMTPMVRTCSTLCLSCLSSF